MTKLNEIVLELLVRYGGYCFNNGIECVTVSAHLDQWEGLEIKECEKIAGTNLFPIAWIDDQFDSLFLVSDNGRIFYWFLDDGNQSIESYADNLIDAIAKRLHVSSWFLFLYRRRAKSQSVRVQSIRTADVKKQ